jgi:putative transposase
MDMKKRTFTKEEKLRIIKEAAENGIQATLNKCDIYVKKLVLNN